MKTKHSDIFERLAKIVGSENLTSDPLELYLYSMDVSVRYQHMPDMVIRPSSTEEVSAIVKLANEENIPVTPRGGGSGVAGGAVPLKGGIVLDMTSMNKIVETDIDNQCVVTQAGILHALLNEELAKHGFFFPPDPGSSKMCTIGGQVAIGGGGVHALKYGAVKDYVMGLTVVLPTGHIVRTGGKIRKKATGYDLSHLFVGSEGTLGVITEIILKIMPIPESKAIVSAYFDNIEEAAKTVNQIFLNRVIPSAMEILDRSAIKAVNKYRPEMDLPEVDAILLIEVDGSKEESTRMAKIVSEICTNSGAEEVEWSDDPEKCNELWEVRHLVGAATNRLSEDLYRVYEGEDITVPVSKVVDAVKAVREISEKNKISIVTFGHIGDGNIHPAIIIDKRKPEQWKTLDQVVSEIQEMALSLGGTVSGEHGTGILRASYMERENGPVAMNLMRKIKRVFDPKGIMNPGKLDLEGGQ